MRVSSAEIPIGKYKHTNTKVQKYKIYKYTQRHKYTNISTMWDPVASAEIKTKK